MKLAVIVLALSAAVSCSARDTRPGAARGSSPASATPTSGLPLARVTISDGPASATFTAEVARTASEMARGLMGRPSLGAREGMLFVWDDEAPRSFWMKDTLIPLDLIVIRGGEVVQILSLEPCEADPCPTSQTVAARAVLEIAAGTLEGTGLGVSAQVSAPGVL